MVVEFPIILQLNQKQVLYKKNQSKNYNIMDNKGACHDSKNIVNGKNNLPTTKESFEEKSNSNGWWPNDVDEKFEPRKRWSFGSDISIEAVENLQSRLCCSPVDEFDSTVSSESEDLIVNNTEEGSEIYEQCINKIYTDCSPQIKNVIVESNGKKQSKPHDVYTANDELIDYSKRYTTDSSTSMVENKNINAHVQQQQQQQRRIVINNKPVAQKKSMCPRSKGYRLGDYAETDLDQPTDYSLRYAEEDTDEEEKEDSRFYCTDSPADDFVKTYYTEGTPSNFSTATSMSDLLILEDTRDNDENTNKQQRQESNDKSEKSTKDNRIVKDKQKFLSDLPKIHMLEKTRELDDHGKLRTPPQSPIEVVCDRSKERKIVTYNSEENNFAQETPLMFSRSSSLDSLSEFEQSSIQDDRSSVVSDFSSHRNSGVVSPSELPDSPTQTVPPSPQRLINNHNFKNLEQQKLPIKLQRQAQQQQQQQLQNRAAPQLQSQFQKQKLPTRVLSRNSATPDQITRVQRSHVESDDVSLMQRPRPEGRGQSPPPVSKIDAPSQQRIAERCISVFEDNFVRFKDESGKLSTAASSLSALTIDDEDDNISINNHELINKITSIKVIKTNASIDSVNDKLDVRQNQSNGHTGYRNSHVVNAENDSCNYTTIFSNKETVAAVQNNRSYRDTWYDNDSNDQINNKARSNSPLCKQNQRNGNDVIFYLQNPEVPDIIIVDSVRTYCTEDTPIFVSPYGSDTNLSSLSALSISDDDFDYNDFIENERSLRSPNLDGAERSNSRANSYNESLENSNASTDDDDDDDDDKNYEKSSGSSLITRRRIDVSPFESQMNLNFSLLRIEEEDEETAEQEVEYEKNNETRSLKSKLMPEVSDNDDDDDYQQLSHRNSECSDDEEELQVLERCIKSGVSKVTRRSFDPRSLL